MDVSSARLAILLRRARYPVTELATLRAPKRTRMLSYTPRHIEHSGDDPLGLRAAAKGLAEALPAWTAESADAARVEERTGLAWSGFTVLNRPMVNSASYLQRLIIKSFLRSRRAGCAYDEAYLLRHVWETNHYHLLLDLVPQLALARAAGVSVCLISEALECDSRFRWLVLDNPEFSDLRFVAEPGVAEVARLVFGNAGWASAETAAFVAAIAPVDGTQTATSRIYITRRPGTGRVITNEPAVLELLRNNEFVVLDLDELSLDEQIRHFRSARVVVGAHGAGLANLVFARPPMTLVELVPDRLAYPFYFNLASAIGAEHRAVLVSSSADGHPGTADVTVDIDGLKAELAKVCR